MRAFGDPDAFLPRSVGRKASRRGAGGVGYRKCLTGLAEVSDTYVTLFIYFSVRRAKTSDA
jgi:hypothetical protein